MKEQHPKQASELGAALGVGPLVAQLLINRGRYFGCPGARVSRPGSDRSA